MVDRETVFCYLFTIKYLKINRGGQYDFKNTAHLQAKKKGFLIIEDMMKST